MDFRNVNTKQRKYWKINLRNVNTQKTEKMFHRKKTGED